MKKLIFFSVLALLTSIASATPKTLSISGYLEDTNGPVNNSVSMLILVGDGTCFPYQKTAAVTVSDGYFSVDLDESGSAGSASLSALFDIASTTAISGVQSDNTTSCSISGGSRSTASYSAHVTVAGEAMGLIPIRASAFAHFAHKAETASKIQGQFVSSSTPTMGQVLRFSAGNWAPASLMSADIGDMANYVLQSSIPTCSSGEFLRKTIPSTIVCETPTSTTGVTSITGGSGITTSSSTGAVTVSIGTDSIQNNMIVDGAIDTAKIADDSISTAKMISGAITSAKIQDATIQSADLAPGSVDVSAIANGAVTPSKLNNSGATTGSIIRFGSSSSWQVEATGPGANQVPSSDSSGNLIVNGLKVNGTAEINGIRLCQDNANTVATINMACPGVTGSSFCSCSKNSDPNTISSIVPAANSVTVNFSFALTTAATVKCICYN